MRKIQLDPETLRVVSFEASSALADARGTVHGHYSVRGTCDGRVATCQVHGTCAYTCVITACTGTQCV